MKLHDWLWLAGGLGPGAQNAGAVIEALVEGRPYEQQLTKGQAAALAATRPEEYAPLAEACTAQGITLVHYGMREYPERLRHIPGPPPVLYCKGDTALLNHPAAIGMVGTRRPSAYGADAAKKIGRELAAAGVLLVSGLAAGLDSEAHKAALAEEAPTVACIAFGHSFCYPSANRKLMEVIARHGLVVGEYPPDTEPQKPFFLHRNRLIAGLTNGLLVTEARRHSGTMSTVNFASEFGRDVFAVPGSIFSPLAEGTNAMIREGACLVTCGADVLDVYGLEPRGHRGAQTVPEGEAALSDGAAKVLGLLGPTPIAIEAVCTGSGFSPAAAMAALTELELAGLARQQAGRRFVAVS